MRKRVLTLLVLCAAAFLPNKTARAQVITNQPQSATVNYESTAEFTVGASNATSYQWQFNGVNLTNGGNISGVTNATLTLEDVSSNQMGNYSVLVNNSLSSSNAALAVIPGTVVRFTLSSFIGGGPSNIDVQLFDHDKPATVQNFLHYVTSGAYTNMFFDRCVTGFVLQGGDYGASNQTATAPPLSGWNIFDQFTTAPVQPNPPYPYQVDNEFNVGPLIHNRFGTIAMAKLGSQPDSASTAFFFNLADNSANLDNQNGGFTVFGRILNGTNTLQYFNTLTNNGIDSSANFLTPSGNLNLGDLPLDYTNNNFAPANSNLLFCDFSFPDGPPTSDTNPPVVAVTNIPFGLLETNANPIIEGAASDDVGLAEIRLIATPQMAPDGTFPNFGVSITNYAFGTTNWIGGLGATVTGSQGLTTNRLPPGNYLVTVQSQDGAGNLSQATNFNLTNTVINIVGNGGATYSNMNAVGYPFSSGFYSLIATPAAGNLFDRWTGPNVVTFDSNFSIPVISGYIWTATFISNTMPDSLGFTFPTAGEYFTNTTFNITGTISNVPSPPVTLTMQLISRSTSSNAIPIQTNTGITGFSFSVTNLPLDSYSVEIRGTDQAGNTTLISEDFTVTTNTGFQLNIVGPGTVSGITNGEVVQAGSPFQATATPNSGGDLFYEWTYGNITSINPVFTNSVIGGQALTATFISNSIPNVIAFQAPVSPVLLTNGTVVVGGTISNDPALPLTLKCQIFSPATLLAVTPALTLSNATTNWGFVQSNMTLGNYIAVVLATDQAGNETIITTNFTTTSITNLPTITVLSPASNELVTADLPITVSGTASDNVLPITGVGCYLGPQRAFDGTYPNGGNNLFASASGISNWSANFGLAPPGVYVLYAEAQDTVGNIGLQTNIYITNTAILVNGQGTVTVIQGTNNITNYVGYPLQNGVSYQMTATPGPGQAFVSWTAGGYVTTNPLQTFTMVPNLEWTATFAPSNTAKGISFTYPAANARLSTNSFVIKGRMASTFKSARVSCEIASLTTSFTTGPIEASSTTTTWSAAVTNLPVDNYILIAEATNSSGQTTRISERFTVLPFTKVAGTYTGLFISTNAPVSPTNSGSLTFTIAATGVMSGKLLFPAYAAIPIYPLLVTNEYFSTGVTGFGLANFHHDSWGADIFMDLSGSNNAAVGTIASSNWSAQVFCYKTVPRLTGATTPAVGKYAFTIKDANQTNSSGTNGYATLTVSPGGNLAVAGMLPDNTTFSESTRVASNGYWPICVIPSGATGGKGLLIGWESFTNSGSSSGELLWYKQTNVGMYYTKGIGLASNAYFTVAGTNFVRPPAGSQFSIVFQGGYIASPLTNSLSVNNAGQFIVTGGAGDKLHISLAASGAVSGSFVNPANGKTLRFKGIFLGSSQGGSGFIPDANGETGSFVLTPSP